MDRVRAHEVDVTGYALKRLGELDGLVVYGPSEVEHRGGMVSFTLGDIHPHDVAQVLDSKGSPSGPATTAPPLPRRPGSRPHLGLVLPVLDHRRGRRAGRRPRPGQAVLRLGRDDMGLEDLYQEIILDHYRKPRHPGRLGDAQVEVHHYNPVVVTS